MPSMLQGFYTQTFYLKIYHWGKIDHIRKGQNGTGFSFAPIHFCQFIEGGGGGGAHIILNMVTKTGISYLHKLVHIYKSTFSTFKPGFITITIPVLPH